jgi:hypothetical protein
MPKPRQRTGLDRGPRPNGAGADFHFVEHNAAGMVSVQLGVSVTETLIRLRGYAFGDDRPKGPAQPD